jgi:NADPH-dependent curcumin reductase CurA
MARGKCPRPNWWLTDRIAHCLRRSPRAMEAIEALVGWVSAGDIVYEVDVQEGFDNIPSTLQRLYTGENFGKQLLKI